MTENKSTGDMGAINEGNYRAFLLRCWQEPGARPGWEAAWRFALVQTGDEGTTRAFSTLDEMVVYLQDQLANNQ